MTSRLVGAEKDLIVDGALDPDLRRFEDPMSRCLARVPHDCHPHVKQFENLLLLLMGHVRQALMRLFCEFPEASHLRRGVLRFSPPPLDHREVTGERISLTR